MLILSFLASKSKTSGNATKGETKQATTSKKMVDEPTTTKKDKKTAPTKATKNVTPTKATKKVTPSKADKTKSVEKAKLAKDMVQGEKKRRLARKVHTSVTFHRPKTLRLARSPKYPRTAIASRPFLDKYSIIKSPLSTESAMKKIEDENTIVFLCNIRSNKHQIKKAVEELYKIRVSSVRTLIRPDAQKKAYVRLTPDYEAGEVAAKVSSFMYIT
jgi:large subunit ribosomal protein L23Ae